MAGGCDLVALTTGASSIHLPCNTHTQPHTHSHSHNTQSQHSHTPSPHPVRRLLWVSLHLSASLHLSYPPSGPPPLLPPPGAITIEALPRALAGTCGFTAGGPEALLAAVRAPLLSRCKPAEAANTTLEAVVLAQLLLEGPEELVGVMAGEGGPSEGRVVPPSPSDNDSTTSYGSSRDSADATGRGCTTSSSSSHHHQHHWSSESFDAAINALMDAAPLLARNARAGALCMRALEAALHALVQQGGWGGLLAAGTATPTPSAPSAAPPQSERLSNLLGLLLNMSALGQPLLASLRAAQFAVAQSLVPPSALLCAPPTLSALTTRAAGAVQHATVRLQAVYTLHTVLATLQASQTESDHSGALSEALGAVGAALVDLVRLDPQSDVRAAALGALKPLMKGMLADELREGEILQQVGCSCIVRMSRCCLVCGCCIVYTVSRACVLLSALKPLMAGLLRARGGQEVKQGEIMQCVCGVSVLLPRCFNPKLSQSFLPPPSYMYTSSPPKHLLLHMQVGALATQHAAEVGGHTDALQSDLKSWLEWARGLQARK